MKDLTEKKSVTLEVDRPDALGKFINRLEGVTDRQQLIDIGINEETINKYFGSLSNSGCNPNF